MIRLITLSALMLAALSASAQLSVKKIDINKTGPAAGSEPYHYVEYKGRAYFTATDGIHGRELWWSDGGDAGMVADFNPGNTDGISLISDLCVVKNVLYFCAGDGQSPGALRSFNGRDPAAMAAGFPRGVFLGLTELNNKLYFLGPGSGAYSKLFEFDPDSAWSFKADSLPGTTGWYDYWEKPVVFKGRILYEVEMDTAIGRELYQYVPGQGLSLVADINPGSGWSYPTRMVVLDDKLFFQAADPQYGYELYVWDGVNPVQRVTDIQKGSSNSFSSPQYPQYNGQGVEMVGYHGKLYFSALNKQSWPNPADYDLMSYDPANGKLKVVKPRVFASNMAVYAGNLYFTGYADSSFTTTTFMYNEVLGGGNFGAQFTPWLIMERPAMVNNKLFFSMYEPFGDDELHVLTDPRALGVPEVADGNESKLYPNPVATEAHISFTLKQATKLVAQLTDIQGRVVYASEAQQYSAGSHEIKMPVQRLAAGNYIYSVMNDRGEVVAKGRMVKE